MFRMSIGIGFKIMEKMSNEAHILYWVRFPPVLAICGICE
jgi:hypothetical protein